MFFVCQRSVDRVHGDTEQTLMELQHSVERLQELLEEVMDKANREKMGQAQEVVDNLEAEVKELRRRDNEMKDLFRCEDDIQYLQVCDCISVCIFRTKYDPENPTHACFRHMSPCAVLWSQGTFPRCKSTLKLHLSRSGKQFWTSGRKWKICATKSWERSLNKV